MEWSEGYPGVWPSPTCLPCSLHADNLVRVAVPTLVQLVLASNVAHAGF